MRDGNDQSPKSDVARVRDVLSRELETITRYENLAAEATSPEVQSFFLHLAAEEKEHVAEAIQMLRKLDEGLEPHFAQVFDAAHFTGGQAAATPPAPAPAPSPPASKQVYAIEDLKVPADPRHALYALPAPPPTAGVTLTVGALKRRIATRS